EKSHDVSRGRKADAEDEVVFRRKDHLIKKLRIKAILQTYLGRIGRAWKWRLCAVRPSPFRARDGGGRPAQVINRFGAAAREGGLLRVQRYRDVRNSPIVDQARR